MQQIGNMPVGGTHSSFCQIGLLCCVWQWQTHFIVQKQRVEVISFLQPVYVCTMEQNVPFKTFTQTPY